MAAASALISPNGLDQYLMTFKMLGMQFAFAYIPEWRGIDFTTFQPIFVWIALATLGGYALGIRLPLSRLAMVLILLYLALTHVRHEELLGFIAPLLVAVATRKATRPGNAPGACGSLPFGTRAWPGPQVRSGADNRDRLGFGATVVALDRRGLQPPEARCACRRGERCPRRRTGR